VRRALKEPRRTERTARIAFTYMGTVVGAGFASGQEIFQFFTKYGATATWCILVAVGLFVGIGVRLLLAAHRLGVESYEELNRRLFGERTGRWIGLFLMAALFGISVVMTAGAGSLLEERFGLPLEAGLLATVLAAYTALRRGLQAIIAANSIVVPAMAVFVALAVWRTVGEPQADNWLSLESDKSPLMAWTSPWLYGAFNLATAQAVLVPLGASVRDRRRLLFGGTIGGVGIGAMLLGMHFALSAHMPDVSQFEVPMSAVMGDVGPTAATLFSLVVLGEIFTTLIADLYGLSLQIRDRFGVPPERSVPALLALCFAAGQFGFSALLSVLYPLFGLISAVWLGLMLARRRLAA